MVNWNDKLAGRTTFMRRSAIREILKLTQRPDIISFAGGLPAPELFPVERIEAATQEIWRRRSSESLQYNTTEGLTELRDWIAARLSRGGVNITRDNILIVSGSQQAIDLVGRVLLDDGDHLVLESPTYVGMLTAWRSYQPRFSVIPTDADGLIVDEYLETVLRQKPKLAYLMPNFQNPQGTTLSYERRVELVKLLAEYDVAVMEDNPYGELRYSGDALPALYELEAQQRGSTKLDGLVVYAGTFSKILTPGLRVGWVAAPEEVIEKLVQAKQGADLQTSTLSQILTYEVCKDGFIDGHIEQLRAVYRERRDVMLAAMERYFPEEARWSRPEGGLFLMVTVPEHIDSGELLKDAIEHKVAFVPGTDFYITGGQNTFRLNYSNAQPDMIEEGIHRLGTLLKEVTVRQVV
ncbi:MAG TPA: PLP-dependent aminotransferase family protein [Phototrophicaceae bacterium]|nr:PLP-dependent aminotransferase family protein [Phototrophicaceae bacterium]